MSKHSSRFFRQVAQSAPPRATAPISHAVAMSARHSRGRGQRAQQFHSEVQMQVIISFMASLQRFGHEILESPVDYQG